jgi:hypothetical protein
MGQQCDEFVHNGTVIVDIYLKIETIIRLAIWTIQPMSDTNV